MNADRILAFAAALGCKALEVRDCLRSLAGNGRPASLDEHFATVPRDVNPGWQEAAAAFADADAAWDEPTPEFTAVEAMFARIDAVCAEWAVEVQALADLELRDLIEGDL